MVLQQTAGLHPFDRLEISCASGGTLVVKDAKNRIYFQDKASCIVPVTVAGAPGKHTAVLLDKKGNLIGSSEFMVTAETRIDDGSKISDMFSLYGYRWFHSRIFCCRTFQKNKFLFIQTHENFLY